MLVVILVFLVVYICIALELFSNTVIAMLGGLALIFTHTLNQHQAVQFIDFNTIGLLLGMMIIVNILRKSGVFEYLAIRALKLAKGDPWWVLVWLSIFTGVLSAFVDNVTAVIIAVPITLAISDALSISPMPFLVSQILFSNIGGTATLIGDPPNILIGNAAHIGFMAFFYHNAPVVLIIGVVVLALLKLIYRKELVPIEQVHVQLTQFDERRAVQNQKLLIQSGAVFAVTIIGFMIHNVIHLELATISMIGAFGLILITRENINDIFKEVDWTSLFFFIGLFMLVGGLEITGVIHVIAHSIISITNDLWIMTLLILWGSMVFSAFIDNVPFTAAMMSVLKSISMLSAIDIKPLCWALSLGACLGGNATIIGAAANVVVANFAKNNNCPIRFIDYMKIALPITVLMLLICSVYIYIVDF